MPSDSTSAIVYTDGSCHTQSGLGGWAAIIFVDNEKIVLTGIARDTTHNRMELLAVIKSIEYIRARFNSVSVIHVYTDSQYVAGLEKRKGKLVFESFRTKSGDSIRSADLVQALFALESLLVLDFTKIKAHQKVGDVVNYNIEVDKLVRKLVRDEVKLSAQL